MTIGPEIRGIGQKVERCLSNEDASKQVSAVDSLSQPQYAISFRSSLSIETLRNSPRSSIAGIVPPTLTKHHQSCLLVPYTARGRDAFGNGQVIIGREAINLAR